MRRFPNLRRQRSILIWLVACLMMTPLGRAATPPLVLDLEPITDTLPYRVPSDQPLTLLLSKTQYPAEDQHLDAILWLAGDRTTRPQGRLRVTLSDPGDGRVLREQTIASIPAHQLFLALRLPDRTVLPAGGPVQLSVTWLRPRNHRAVAQSIFEVRPDHDRPRQGRIGLRIPNTSGAHHPALPVRVGVPFPPGVLEENTAIRLIDENGATLPLQTRVTSRWSRRGSIRWLLCDFSVALAGTDRQLHLAFGGDASPAISPNALSWSAGQTPQIQSSGITLDENGFHWRIAGRQHTLLEVQALLGGYVVHEDGRRYVMPTDTPWVIEEAGSESVTLKAQGWYEHPESGDRFCQFINRYVFHAESQAIKLYHTWIFTGDAYEDRIRDIGWQFDIADTLQPEGFLAASDQPTPWIEGDALAQRDHDQFQVHRNGESQTFAGRPLGVMSAAGPQGRLSIAVRDFWQNYPQALAFDTHRMTFHLWPPHGQRSDRPLTPENAMRLWFAHEGDRLDFALPEAYTQEPITLAIPASRRHLTGYTLEGLRHERANAQGIAKTTEFWILPGSTDTEAPALQRLIEGWQQQTLSATVDPHWVASSGVFHEMHPQDYQRYPREEAAYMRHALAPLAWQERVAFYGKWIWGGMPAGPDLASGQAGFHRGFRKSHQGWPYSWLAYARTGDARLRHLADAGTRHQTDVAFVHYSDERLNNRPRGWYTRFQLPWADNRSWPQVRSRESKTDYLWHSYYLTGNRRSLDVALDFAHLIKYSGSGRREKHDDQTAFKAVGDDARTSVELLQTYLEMYQETFDPWFLAAYQQIARIQLEAARSTRYGPMDTSGYQRLVPDGQGQGWLGHFEGTGIRDYHRFTGDATFFDEVTLPYLRAWGSQRAALINVWAQITPMLEPRAYGLHTTGDPHFAGLIRTALDELVASTYHGDPDYYQGFRAPIGTSGDEWGPSYTGYLLRDLPAALAAEVRFQDAGQQRSSATAAFYQLSADEIPSPDSTLVTRRWHLIFQKKTSEALDLRLDFSPAPAWADDESASFVVTDTQGHRWLEASTSNRQLGDHQLPESAPPGIYHVRIESRSPVTERNGFRHHPALALPVTPAGTPEVVQTQRIGQAYYFHQHWFHLPRDEEVLLMELHPTGRTGLEMITLQDAHGQVLREKHFHRTQANLHETIQWKIPLTPQLRGQPVRLMRPLLSGGFTLGDGDPVWVATSEDRLFSPH